MSWKMNLHSLRHSYRLFFAHNRNADKWTSRSRGSFAETARKLPTLLLSENFLIFQWKSSVQRVNAYLSLVYVFPTICYCIFVTHTELGSGEIIDLKSNREDAKLHIDKIKVDELSIALMQPRGFWGVFHLVSCILWQDFLKRKIIWNYESSQL